jgi:phosphotransferase system enzyme I (PtsI)
MAGEPALVPILLGLGLDEFSMPPLLIPETKFIIRSVSMAEMQELAKEVLKLTTGKEVENYCQAKLKEIIG